MLIKNVIQYKFYLVSTTFSKNDLILSVRKHYYALGLEQGYTCKIVAITLL